MTKKRLSAVVNVLDGLVVQSFGFNSYLPIGDPKYVLLNLDRWHVDEIILQSISRSRKGLGPDFDLLHSISDLQLSTPLIYGGGIRSPIDADSVISLGADRIIVGNLLFSDPHQLSSIVNHVGKQAVIGSVPINSIVPFTPVDYVLNRTHHNFTFLSELLDSGLLSELLLIDYNSEGYSANWKDLHSPMLPSFPVPLILFGGLTNPSDISNLLSLDIVSSVAIGNILSYKEHAYQTLKQSIDSSTLRPYIFSSVL